MHPLPWFHPIEQGIPRVRLPYLHFFARLFASRAVIVSYRRVLAHMLREPTAQFAVVM